MPILGRRQLQIVVMVGALLAGVLVSAPPSVAAASATAILTEGASGLPTQQGEVQEFMIEVANNGDVGGDSLDWVRVRLPTTEAGVTLAGTDVSAPDGWSASAQQVGDYQAVVYQADTLVDGILPGSQLGFSLPGSVQRPQDTEVEGVFDVDVSGDGGGHVIDASPAEVGALTTRVEILEVLDDVAVRSPVQATGGTVTAGQSVVVGYPVRNHALDAVDVTAELAADDEATITVASPVTATISGDPFGSTLVGFDVDSSAAVSEDTTVTLTAAVSSAGADAEQRPSGQVDVQMPSQPSLEHTSFAPRAVSTGAETEGTSFTVEVTKSATPGLTLGAGTLEFADTTATLLGGPYLVSDESTTLTFEADDPVSGVDGVYDATFTFPQVEDENGFVQDHHDRLPDLIEIDTGAPSITVAVQLPRGKTAVRNGDPVTVYGEISGKDVDLETLEVVLTPDVGEPVAVPVTTSASASGHSYEGTISVNFEDGRDPDAYDQDREKSNPSNPFATTFTASAQVADRAGNGAGTSTGTADTGAPLGIDNVVPNLGSLGLTGWDAEQNFVIRIEFDDLHPATDAIRGGCDPLFYEVDGTPGMVTGVRTPSGVCDSTETTAGTRILVLAREEDRTPTVTYDPLLAPAAAPVVDGAGNAAPAEVIDTTGDLPPPPPEIIQVSRNGGEEDAYSDDAGYWTRFGDDDLTVTFTGYRNGWYIQVLDDNGNIIRSKELYREQFVVVNEDAPGEDGQDTISVPIGSSAGGYLRQLRFVDRAVGERVDVPVNLDTVPAEITNVDRRGQEVTVSFNGQLVAGTNHEEDWAAAIPDGGGQAWQPPVDVATTSDVTERLLTFDLDDPTTFDAVRYSLISPDGQRYQDRGGNSVANQQHPA